MNDASQGEGAPRTLDADFFEFRRTRDRALRNGLIERHVGIAYHLAGRYRHRGNDGWQVLHIHRTAHWRRAICG